MNSDHPLINLSGLTASAFTPMHQNGELNLKIIPKMVDRLVDQQISGICVCSGTGEGMQLTTSERKQILEAFLKAANGRIPVISQVGHNSLHEAKGLAAHAKDAGAAAISFIPPTFSKPNNVDQLIKCLQFVSGGAPDLPLIYHHSPSRAGFELDWPIFLNRSTHEGELPSLAGIKFNGSRLSDLKTCVELANGHLRIFYGTDERLLDGLIAGAHSAMGSTYNFSASLSNHILSYFEQGLIEEARQLQELSFAISWAFMNFGTVPGQKAIMNMTGLDCGPPRLPLVPLSPDKTRELKQKLEELNFFKWT